MGSLLYPKFRSVRGYCSTAPANSQLLSLNPLALIACSHTSCRAVARSAMAVLSTYVQACVQYESSRACVQYESSRACVQQASLASRTTSLFDVNVQRMCIACASHVHVQLHVCNLHVTIVREGVTERSATANVPTCGVHSRSGTVLRYSTSFGTLDTAVSTYSRSLGLAFVGVFLAA